MKNIPEEVLDAAGDATGDASEKLKSGKASVRSQLTEEQRAFIRTLNSELQKFNKFFINSEEDFVMKESRLDDEYGLVVDEATGGRAPGFTVGRCTS